MRGKDARLIQLENNKITTDQKAGAGVSSFVPKSEHPLQGFSP
jgi:hypothetical protein